VRLLAAALLAVVLVPGTDDEVVQRVHVRVAGDDAVVASCNDVSGNGSERGVTRFRFRYEVHGVRRGPDNGYTGTVTFSLGEVTITMPRSVRWRGMTAADRERAEALLRAIYHHEVGHVRLAEAVRDELNAREAIIAPDPFAFGSAADAIGREGLEKFRTEEREYDALTDHGRKQHAAPGALSGPDTVLICR
jgi:predicted secreted Zn-dependent protease